MKLRHELLHFPTDDGGLEVVDLLLQRLHRFSALEAQQLAELPGPVSLRLAGRLEELMLVEGDTADALRESARQGQIRRPPKSPPAWPSAEGPWELAARLPAEVAPMWRQPERWRRMAEDRLAGRLLLRAEGFLTEEGARALKARADGLPFAHQDGMYARGECYNEHDAAVDRLGVMALFASGPLHTLISYVMGEDLTSRIFLRCWRLTEGGRIAVHNDGVHYVTTFSIGLSEGWTAGQGGAIAFGVPGAGGIEATERWLPHLGDLILFRPTAMSWHAVEEVRSGERMTVTGHYVSEEYPG